MGDTGKVGERDHAGRGLAAGDLPWHLLAWFHCPGDRGAAPAAAAVQPDAATVFAAALSQQLAMEHRAPCAAGLPGVRRPGAVGRATTRAAVADRRHGDPARRGRGSLREWLLSRMTARLVGSPILECQVMK